MNTEVFQRYQQLQRYVGWTDDDACRIRSLQPLVQPRLTELVDDFYREIERHPDARKVITGGAAQVERLKGTLLVWLEQLLAGQYDEDYVQRRWRVGCRHVEIGLDQVYTNVAMSRLRRGLVTILQAVWKGSLDEMLACRQSLNTLLDLDLAIIEDAYQAEFIARQNRIERLAALGQVAGGVAHELRNPLNVIRTSVYYLLNARNPTPEKTGEHLQRIEHQVQVSNNVITALSNFAKLPVPELKPVDVGECIREVLQLESLQDGISVVVNSPTSLPRALADAQQLQIVLSNLVRNARDSMPDGGTLTIETNAPNGKLEIRVKDTGSGIPADDLRRIMEPFYSTKARGIGLGLPLSRTILEKNKGRMRVDSQVGAGSTFTIELEAAVD
jgi:two-component system, NtrC family, sensor kinase